MTTLEQIKQKQEELNQMIQEYEKQNTPSEYGWKPEEGDDYWFITGSGDFHNYSWTNHSLDAGRFSIGNCFKTREQAEKYKLRLESMKPKYLPKESDKYFFIYNSTGGFWIDSENFNQDNMDSDLYLLGRTFRTKQEAQDWITNYAKAWEL